LSYTNGKKNLLIQGTISLMTAMMVTIKASITRSILKEILDIF